MYIGVNSRKTHPCSQRFSKEGEVYSALHAEQDAMLKVPRQCRHQAKLYVARVRPDMTFGMSKPCSMCNAFLKSFDVKKVYYTDNSGQWTRL